MQKCLRLVFGAGISCVYLLLGLYQIFSLCKRAIAHQKWFSVQNFRCVKIKGCKRVKIKFGAYATTKISRCVLFSTFQRAWQYFPRNSRSKAGCMFGHRSMSGQIGSWMGIERDIHHSIDFQDLACRRSCSSHFDRSHFELCMSGLDALRTMTDSSCLEWVSSDICTSCSHSRTRSHCKTHFSRCIPCRYRACIGQYRDI